MKKPLFFTACLLILLGSNLKDANSQSTLGIGVRGGINFANLNNSDIDTGTRTGIILGTYVNYIVPNTPVSIQPELIYSQKGFEYNDLTTELDYLELPLLVNFHFVNKSGFIPKVYAGPYFSYNVQADSETPEVPDESEEPAANFEDHVNDTGFGVIVGAGVDVNRLNFGLRYSAGLTKVYSEGSDAKNRALSIIAGISF